MEPCWMNGSSCPFLFSRVVVWRWSLNYNCQTQQFKADERMLLKQVCGLTGFASSMSAHYGKKTDKKGKGTLSELNVQCCVLKPWLWRGKKKQQIITNSPTSFCCHSWAGGVFLWASTMIPISPQNKLTKVLTFMFGFADWEPRQPISAAMDVSTQSVCVSCLNLRILNVGCFYAALAIYTTLAALGVSGMHALVLFYDEISLCIFF